MKLPRPRLDSDFASVSLAAVRALVHFALPALLLLAMYRHLTPFFARACAVALIVGLLHARYAKRRGKRKLALASVAAVLVGIAFVDVVWHLHNAGRMQVYADALHGYIPQSEKSPWSWEFWFLDVKPFVTPLLFKLVGRDIARLNDVFVTGYLLATLSFLGCLFALFRDRTERLLGFYLFVAFFLNQSLMGAWLTVAQSETPAMVSTLFMIAVFAWGYARRSELAAGERRGTRHAYTAAVILSTIAFSFSRDTNLYFLPVLLVFYGFTLRARAQRLVVVGAVAAIFVVHNATMNESGRWKFSLANVVLQRILPDESLRALFRDRYGLPVEPLLAAGVNRRASETFANKELLIDIEGGGEDWVSRRGLAAYKSFLLTHPRFVLSEWSSHWSAYNASFFRWTLRRGPRYRLPAPIFSFPGPVSLAGAVLVLFGSFLFLRDNPVPALSALHAFVVGLVAFHGDAMEVERHLQQAAMTLRISYLLLVPLLYRAIRAHLDPAGRAGGGSDRVEAIPR